MKLKDCSVCEVLPSHSPLATTSDTRVAAENLGSRIEHYWLVGFDREIDSMMHQEKAPVAGCDKDLTTVMES